MALSSFFLVMYIIVTYLFILFGLSKSFLKKSKYATNKYHDPPQVIIVSKKIYYALRMLISKRNRLEKRKLGPTNL